MNDGEDRRAEYLIVDTSAFIRNTQLQDIGKNIYTIEEVLEEIKSKRQLKNLIVLPYELQVKDVDPEDIKFITQFSKKTGDYPSLSATDIKVLALTYRFEKDHVGTEHLKTEPVQKSVELIDHSLLSAKDVVGFYMPSGSEDSDEESQEEVSDNENDEVVEGKGSAENEELQEAFKTIELQEQDEGVSMSPKGETAEMHRSQGVSENMSTVFNNESTSDSTKTLDSQDLFVKCDSNDGEVSADSDFDENDDAGWITPGNVLKAKKEMNAGVLEEKPVKVACLTTDFAMQNVLKQIGLNVLSIDGLLIQEMKTFILRCYACFKTTSIMTKVFCPNCGNKTLKRVAVTIDNEGKQHIHINFKRPLTGRGKRFSLPAPQGGKYALNPVLVEDQRVPQQRLTKLARQKNNPLDPDYIAGFSPFTMRDVSSRSVVLGLHRKHEFKHWMKKNPNECMTKKRKK